MDRLEELKKNVERSVCILGDEDGRLLCVARPDGHWHGQDSVTVSMNFHGEVIRSGTVHDALLVFDLQADTKILNAQKQYGQLSLDKGNGITINYPLFHVNNL